MVGLVTMPRGLAQTVLVDASTNDGSFENGSRGGNQAGDGKLNAGETRNIASATGAFSWSFTSGSATNARAGWLDRNNPVFDTDGNCGLFTDDGTSTITSVNLMGTNGYTQVREGDTFSLTFDANAINGNISSNIGVSLLVGTREVSLGSFIPDTDQTGFETSPLLTYTASAGDQGATNLRAIIKMVRVGSNIYADDFSLAVAPRRDPLLKVNSALPLFGDLRTQGFNLGSVVRTLSLRNEGAALPLNLSNATFTGVNAGLYSLVNPVPATLAPGASAAIQIRFLAPTSGGAFTAALSIATNDIVLTSLNLDLSAIVAKPIVVPTLLTHWKMDEPGGATTFVDARGSNNGTKGASGLTSGVPGKFGNAISFDRTNGNAFTAPTQGLPVGNAPYAVSYWVNMSALPASTMQTHFSYGRQTPGNSNGLLSNANAGSHFYGNADLSLPAGSFAANQWQLVIATWTGAERIVYINGREVARNTTAPNTVDQEPFRIGGDPRGLPLGAAIDDFAIWRGSLNFVDALSLWNNGFGRPVVNFIPYAPVVFPATVELFVDTSGSDANTGLSLDHPMATLIGARNRMRQMRKLLGLPPDGMRIWVRGGRYPHTETLTLSTEDSGTAAAPVIIDAWAGERPIFDGGRSIDLATAAVVTTPALTAKLHSNGVGNVYSKVVTDTAQTASLIGVSPGISFNDRVLQVARFPNTGFGGATAINQALETGAPNTDGTPGSPVGAAFRMTGGTYDTAKWSAEVGRLRKARMVGYVSADWLKEFLRIDAIDATGLIRLMDATSYNFGNSSVERPYIDNLLAELDAPGEFFYDNTDNRLYFWPPSPLSLGSQLKLYSGPTGVVIDKDVNYVQVRRLSFMHLNAPAIEIRGNNILAAGLTMRNLLSVPFNIFEGTGNKVLSCDIFDCEGGARLNGGTVTYNSIVPAGNTVENCHFAQVYSKSYYGKVISLAGAGNIFRNNLFHNGNGQAVTLGGVDHLVELNEVFNTGIEEGDGGTFYQGASMASWGVQFRHNFFHHIMCIPRLIERAAIFSDDGDQGDVVTENVFYKAGEGFKMNNGAGHQGHGNVAIEGVHSFLVLNGTPSTQYTQYMTYMGSTGGKTPTTGDKANLIGNGMRTFGIPNWQTTVTATNWPDQISPFWKQRYPLFNTVITNWFTDKATNKWGSFTRNVYYQNTSSAPTGVSIPAQGGHSGGTTLSNLALFENPAHLNFKYKTPLPSYAADIPFEDIGLYIDEYRTHMPEKDSYRAIVAARWAGVASDGGGTYDINAVNNRIYFNTGLVMEQLGATPFYPRENRVNTVASSALDWDGSATQPHEGWEYGFFNPNSTAFIRGTVYEASPAWTGGDAKSWNRGAGQAPRASHYAMQPSATQQAVKRWLCTTDSRLRITIDARQLEASTNGQTVRAYVNGNLALSLVLTSASRHQTNYVHRDVKPGDTIDIAVDSQGEATGDWTSVNVTIDNLSPPDGTLAAHWPLDESYRLPSGSGVGYDRRVVAANHRGSNQHAAFTNSSAALVWKPGRIGNSASFDGVDDNAVVSNDLGVNGASELTLSLWCRPDAKGANRGMLTSNGDYFALTFSGSGVGNPVEFRAKNSSLLGPSNSGPVNEWTHVAGVWKAGAIQKLYLNGIEVASNPSPQAGTINITSWVIAQDRALAGRFFDGALDDVALWTRAFTGPQVAELYNNALNGYNAGQGPGDADFDNIPDGWQVKYFGSASSAASEANADSDGDGVSNYGEWLAGTRPDDAASRFVASMTATASDMQLQWPSIPGRTYSITKSSTLNDDWLPVRTGIAPTFPLNTSSVSIDGSRGFYRIEVE